MQAGDWGSVLVDKCAGITYMKVDGRVKPLGQISKESDTDTTEQRV